MPTVTIDHADGSTDTISQTVKWTDKAEIGKMRRVNITVERGPAKDANLEPKADEVSLQARDAFTGRLVDIKKGGSTWTLVCYSFEWDANKESPTAGGLLKSASDDSIITDFINDVSTWTVGTVNSQTGGVEYVFNHALAHEAIRRVEKNVPGEVKFNSDKSVDYVSRLGSDKSASITLSGAAGNLDGEINITDRNRDLDATHFRVIGAHEGEAQVYANLVPSGDTTAQNNLDNVVTYTSPRWSDAADTDWARWPNKDVSSQSAIDEEAAALGEELKDPYIEAKATVTGEDLAIGDTVHVEKPDADLDRDFRIHRIRTVSQGATTVDKVLLSTRTVARKDEAEQQRNSTRFNVAFQGSSVILQGGGARQPVNASVNAFESFRYPSINYEHVAEVEVRGLPYRAYSGGAAAGGDHTHLVTVNHPSHTHDVTHPSHDHDVNIGTQTSNSNTEPGNAEHSTRNNVQDTGGGFWELVDSFTPSVNASMIICAVSVFQATAGEFRLRLSDIGGNTYPNDNGHIIQTGADDENASSTLVLAENTNTVDLEFFGQINISYTFDIAWWAIGEHTHDVSIGTQTSDTALGTNETSTAALGTSVDETSDASGDHTHPIDPGLSEFGSDTPSNVDLIINGSTVASNIGSGEFTTVIDVTGEFNQGQWNDIEASSDSLGHITLRPYVETYKQIGKS